MSVFRMSLDKAKVSVVISIFMIGLLLTKAVNAYPDPKETCLADKSWFPHSQTKEPDNQGFKSTSNCVFHQWSWQMFLWLTQNDDKGHPRFLSFVPPESLLGMNSRNVTQPLKPIKGHGPMDEYLQAGSNTILTDQKGRAVYYAQYLDPTYVKFIETNQLTNPEKVRAFNPETPFDIGSVELKVSWKIVEEGEDVSDFFTINSAVYKLMNENGEIVINYDETEDVTLALVGFHIGGVVNEHPEMIWATFEHHSNAPNVPINFTPDTIISKENSTFYKANTKFSECNINVANTPKLKLDEKTQILSPITQVCRQYQFGNDPRSPKDRIKKMAVNDHNIKTLNTSVLASLDKNDVWSNYYEVGAIWFGSINALKPNMSLSTDEILTGSLKLSNSVIETFTQIQSVQNNCFRCHNTLQRFPPQNNLQPMPGLNLNISRAFENIYFWSQMQQLQKEAAQ